MQSLMQYVIRVLCDRARTQIGNKIRHYSGHAQAWLTNQQSRRELGAVLAFSIIASNNSIMLLSYISIQFFAISTALLLLLIHTLCSSPCIKATPNKFPVSRPPPASFSGISQNFPLLVLLYVCNIRIYFCTRRVLASSE